MLRRLLLLLISTSIPLALLIAPTACVADCVDPDRDLYVWMESNTITLPGIDSLYEGASITWNSEDMQIALTDLGVQGVAQAMPDLFSADSVFTWMGTATPYRQRLIKWSARGSILSTCGSARTRMAMGRLHASLPAREVTSP